MESRHIVDSLRMDSINKLYTIGYFFHANKKVVVRQGPGKDYPAEIYYGEGSDGTQPAEMQVEEIVKCLAVKGDYAKVEGKKTYGWNRGWVPLSCLTKVRLCPTCKGSGDSNLPCKFCNGEGGECCLVGIPPCNKCKGKGWL